MEQIANLLWLHGGGWHSRSTEDGAALAEHGLRVIQGRYRLTGEAHWPAQLDDVRAEARRVRATAPDLPLLVAGDSTGAMLALHAGLRGIDRPGDVDGVLAFWPPVDPLSADFLRLRRHDNPWSGLLGHEPAVGDPATVDATVATHVGSGVPVLLAHGNTDVAVPCSQTFELAGALHAAGHPVHTLVTHGGHALDLSRPDLAAATRAFLTAHLPLPHPPSPSI
ncbi:alpha/beta hydrolase fold domain-containing protein [Plantactinospora sp. GCM10030261]|uniref:alpha/beta hydrolase fold domain-containing protein n=1 Tax=Plantactinospora sp. GCM10030261 TaxID=3273420 RepID=UPI00361CC037